MPPSPPPPPPTDGLGQPDNNGLASLDPSTLDAAPDVSNGTESGWATVAKSINEVDEQKIKDYKEDIDTILVFVSILSSLQWCRMTTICTGWIVFCGPLRTPRRVIPGPSTRSEHDDDRPSHSSRRAD